MPQPNSNLPNHKGTLVEETFAEGFSMRYVRIIVTAIDEYWLKAGLAEFCGYGTSVIGCDAEVAVETMLSSEETPDQRPGAAVLAFGFSAEALGAAIVKRTGQCLMTCPTTAVFDGFNTFGGLSERAMNESEAAAPAVKIKKGDEDVDPKSSAKSSVKVIPLGKSLRFFGDGFQKSKLLGERRFWRVPVMDGEFIVEDTVHAAKGVAGGNFLIQSSDQATGLDAARRASEAIAAARGVIAPFPAGVVRSGSKVGSKYKQLVASTYDAYCPSLRAQTDSKIHPDANCVYEIVVDGVDFDSVSAALKTGIEAACGEGIIAIGAGNYGGNLGPHHFHLHEVMELSKRS